MWECYELRFKAKSPVHIGYGSKLGVINRTRYYIPGKTMWGAVTAVLTREIISIIKEDYNPEMYTNVGEFIQKNMIFSYFYPSDGENVFYPIYMEKGLSFHDKEFMISKEEFERKFISSYISTSVDKTSKTARDESLHEFEIITPKSPKALEFRGYLFIDKEEVNKDNKMDLFIKELKKDEITLKKGDKSLNLFESIKKLQVGGERNYGLGWLELQDHSICKSDKINLYDSGVYVDLNDLSINSDGSVALAHVKLNFELKEVKGDLEPITGREWDKNGPGKKCDNAKICLTPGTRFKSKVKISDFGVWEYSV